LRSLHASISFPYVQRYYYLFVSQSSWDFSRSATRKRSAADSATGSKERINNLTVLCWLREYGGRFVLHSFCLVVSSSSVFCHLISNRVQHPVRFFQLLKGSHVMSAVVAIHLVNLVNVMSLLHCPWAVAVNRRIVVVMFYCFRAVNYSQTPLHGHRLRTPPTDKLTTILRQICHIAMPEPNISTCQDVGMWQIFVRWRPWRCSLVVFVVGVRSRCPCSGVWLLARSRSWSSETAKGIHNGCGMELFTMSGTYTAVWSRTIPRRCWPGAWLQENLTIILRCDNNLR